MRKFQKYIPIRKVEEQADGTLLVWGMATAQKPDSDDEVMDYATTKPEYQKTAKATFAKTAAVDGMETSLFPVREMHQLIAAGCGKSIEFDDDAKEINVGCHIVEESSVKKVKAGVLIGFSHAGEYLKAWKDPVFKGCTRYTSSLLEISLVDSPCLPDALIHEIAEKSFKFVDKNGSSSMVKFKTTERSLAKLSDVDVDRIANAVRKSLHHGTKAADIERKARWQTAIVEKFKTEKAAVAAVTQAVTFVATPKPMQKGMYAVAEFGRCLECLSWLQSMAVSEKAFEGDESEQPQDMAELLDHAIEVFRSVVDEETTELAAQAAILAGTGASTMKVKLLTVDQVGKASEADVRKAYLEVVAEIAEIEKMEKAAKGAVAHLTEMHKAASDHCATMVKAAGDHMTAMHGQIAKCMKTVGGEGAAADTSGNDGKDEKDEEAKKALKAARELVEKSGLKIVDTPAVKAGLTEEEVTERIEKAIKAHDTDRVASVRVGRPTDEQLAKVAGQAGETEAANVGF